MKTGCWTLGSDASWVVFVASLERISCEYRPYKVCKEQSAALDPSIVDACSAQNGGLHRDHIIAGHIRVCKKIIVESAKVAGPSATKWSPKSASHFHPVSDILRSTTQATTIMSFARIYVHSTHISVQDYGNAQHPVSIKGPKCAMPCHAMDWYSYNFCRTQYHPARKVAGIIAR